MGENEGLVIFSSVLDKIVKTSVSQKAVLYGHLINITEFELPEKITVHLEYHRFFFLRKRSLLYHANVFLGAICDIET